MRRPGIEPGSHPWQGCMIPLHHRRLLMKVRVSASFPVHAFDTWSGDSGGLAGGGNDDTNTAAHVRRPVIQRNKRTRAGFEPASPA